MIIKDPNDIWNKNRIWRELPDLIAKYGPPNSKDWRAYLESIGMEFNNRKPEEEK